MSAVRAKSVVIIAASLLSVLLCGTAQGEPSGIEGKTLALHECIAIGLKQNPASEISLQNLKAVRERIGEARGGYYPSFRLSSSYTYTTPSDSKMVSLQDVYDTRLFVKQTLFDAGATSNLIESIRHGIKSQEHDVQRTALDIVLNVRTSFDEALKRGDLVEVARAALNSAEQHLRQARALYKEGMAPRSDVIKAEVQVSSARLDVIRAENSLLLAKANLAAAMGIPVTVEFSLSSPGAVEQATLPPLKNSVELAYAGRPELKGSKARIDSADASVRQARSGLYPNVSFDASYGWQESGFFPNDRKWSAGLTVAIPVFEQLTARSRVSQTSANLAGLKAADTQVRRSIELEVEQAWLALKEAIERFGVTQKTLEQAKEDMRVSEGRYKEGIGNILEVIDAQTALTQARTNYVVASYDIAQAGARLDRATGKGIEEENAKQ